MATYFQQSTMVGIALKYIRLGIDHIATRISQYSHIPLVNDDIEIIVLMILKVLLEIKAVLYWSYAASINEENQLCVFFGKI